MRLRTLAATALLLVSLSVSATPAAAAAEGLTMEARTLLDGHARVGSWMAIAVHLKNDGPPITGELRLAGGSQGRTRFGTPVDLPTQSDKTYVIYAQPPSFGKEMEVALVSGDQSVASAKTTFAIHDASQMTIGVIAERPGPIVSGIDLVPNQNQVGPAIIQLTPEGLPERVEAWGGIDRLIWQDVDAGRLSSAQLAALRGWIAGGGRLVIVGGTAGPSSLAAFPDDLLPYRPTATTEVAPSSLSSLLGIVPPGTADLPALGGERGDGRVLATSGDRVIAAERSRGNGAVTIIGFDPTTRSIADSGAAKDLWQRVLPARTTSGVALSDDSQLLSAVSQLPQVALPPIGGLIALLGAYILLVGPVNYLVLKRLDRREWAWVTMPVLILIFAFWAYAFGSLLRGSDILVNQVAIVRGAPGTTEGAAQVYLGVFSPSRGTYQLQVPGGALLSAPISADFFGGEGTASALDIVQGDPSRIRDLAVSFGALRTIRAETTAEVPLIEADLQVIDGRLKGTVKNASQVAFEQPSIVLGSTVASLKDLAPGATATVDEALTRVAFGQPLSDRVVGSTFFNDPRDATPEMMNRYIRHTMVDQLTYDPNWGSTNQLPADGAVIIGWGHDSIVPVEIAGQTPRATGNVLYYLPTDVAVSGQTTFRGDLMRSNVIDTDAPFFGKDPFSMNFGRGSATVQYRPITFDGTLDATELSFALGWGGIEPLPPQAKPVAPLPSIPPPCADETDPGCALNGWDGMPEVELFDLSAADWVRLPHLEAGVRYAVDQPARYVDPATGTVLARFVNDRSDAVGFSFDVSLTGDIR